MGKLSGFALALGPGTRRPTIFFRKTVRGALSPALALALKLARVKQKKSGREGDIIWAIDSICTRGGGSEKKKKKTKL